MVSRYATTTTLALTLIALSLTACGGGGGSTGSLPPTLGGGSSTPTPSASSTPAPHASPSASTSPSPIPTKTPTPTATPTSTPTPTPSPVVVNAILVAVQSPGTAPVIDAFPGNFDSSSSPIYSIAGPNSGFTANTTILSMAIGNDGDLYVLDGVNSSPYTAEVRVFPANAQGNVAPIRIIPTTNAALNPSNTPSGDLPANVLGLDGDDDLYVGMREPPQVIEFPPNSSGSASPIRSLSTTDYGIEAKADGLWVHPDGSFVLQVGPAYGAGFGHEYNAAYSANASGSAAPTATYWAQGPSSTGPGCLDSGIAFDEVGTVYFGCDGSPANQNSTGQIIPAAIALLDAAHQQGGWNGVTVAEDTTLTTMESPIVYQVANGYVYAVDHALHELLEYSVNGGSSSPPVAALHLSGSGPAVLVTAPYTTTSAM